MQDKDKNRKEQRIEPAVQLLLLKAGLCKQRRYNEIGVLRMARVIDVVEVNEGKELGVVAMIQLHFQLY